MSDIAAALTGSLPRDGSAGMTGPLILSNSNPTNPLEAVSKAYVQSFMVYATGMPVGAAMPFLGNTPPPGFLVCDGQAVSRTTYAELFAVIGTIYGAGDGVHTFNVPDLRNQFIRGKADDRAVGSLQAGSFASHTHPVSDPGHTHGVSASQAAHGHVITTGSHNHSVNDPGHSHNNQYGLLAGPYGSAPNGGSFLEWTNVPTQSAGTGISIQTAGNLGGSADSQQPAVTATIASATTNETIGSTGGTETVPQNMALIYVVKAVNDTTQVGAVTSLSSSDSNMIAIDSTNPAIPELDIKSNIAFGIPKLDAGGKILLAQLPQGSSVLLGYFDASSGANPSQAFPATNYSNGESYIVSVGGTILVRDPATSVESNVLVAVGGILLYLEGQTQPDGWYYSIPVAASSAANISFLPEGTIAATNVQAAIAELDGETQAALGTKAPASAGTALGTSVTPTGTIAATNVQAALAELDGDIQALGVPPASGITFTPTGTIAATNVQAAIVEVADEAVQVSGDTMTGALAAPAFQTGSSGDPAKNFTLSVPAAPDGTMKLARGNAGATTQDIMTVDAAGKVAFPQGATANDPTKLPLAGGTVTGQIKGIAPAAAADLTRKDYVDSKFVTSGVVVVALSSEGGSLSSANADMMWSRAGDIVTLSVRYEILNVGTATGALFANVIANGAPPPRAGFVPCGVGRDPNGQMLQTFISGNSLAAFKYDNGGVANFAGNGRMAITYVAA
jgi:microcystin-dependent protein